MPSPGQGSLGGDNPGHRRRIRGRAIRRYVRLRSAHRTTALRARPSRGHKRAHRQLSVLAHEKGKTRDGPRVRGLH